MEQDLAPLPNIRVNQVVRYHGCKASVVGCWWDSEEWRYEVYISRGKKRGLWSTTEEVLINGSDKR